MMKSLPIVAICRRHNSNKYFPIIWQLVIFIFVSFEQTKSSSVYAYANWLKCYIELDDEEEVIMHQHIIPAEKSNEKVYIEVQPYVSDNRGVWMASTQQDYHDLFASSSKQMETVTTKATTTTSLLKLRLKVPPNMKQKGIQFVVEVKGNGVSFVGPGVMCDGDRAYSRQYDQHVLLQINSTTVSEAAAIGKGEEEKEEDFTETDLLVGDVEIVAGWASGYEAVSLTPKMILRRSTSLKDTMKEATDSTTTSFKKDEGDEEL
ncbi:MAG: hypothetical protein ACI8RD_002241 [Bacillariaceae sp.]|jgi:hypothetical protein